MLLPIKTSIQPRRTPYANYALVIINVVIFLLSYFPHVERYGGQPEYLRNWATQFVLNPQPGHLYLWQFVSYAFLHAGFMHIAGNGSKSILTKLLPVMFSRLREDLPLQTAIILTRYLMCTTHVEPESGR